jgi:hypothetical protein
MCSSLTSVKTGSGSIACGTSWKEPGSVSGGTVAGWDIDRAERLARTITDGKTRTETMAKIVEAALNASTTSGKA